MTEINQKWKIGDCRDLMRELDPDSVDLIVTDPPYGYSFMGKDWDKAVPPVKCWQECLRILKPGALAFIMSAPRQDVLAHNLVNLSDAGFETGFTSIYWTFASGFPKAGNVGKLVDKRGGESISWFGPWLKNWRKENNITQKSIAELFPSKTGNLTGCVANWELGLSIPTPLQFTKICKYFNLPFKNIKEAEREVTGRCDNKIHFENLGNAGYKDEWDVTPIPVTPKAKALDGSYAGFQPKPAVEIIMVVMKPLTENTYVDQALANGKGITWLDDGRIPYQNEKNLTVERYKSDINDKSDIYGKYNVRKAQEIDPQGRFPANLLVSDDVLNDGKERVSKYGESKEPLKDSIFIGNNYGEDRRDACNKFVGDSGSFSRYFDLDAWMDEQIKQLPKEAQKTFPFLITPKASKSEKGTDCTHPTVKPVKLISWLITIGSQKDDLVLDPFLGSGTTLEAGRFTGRRVLGFEISDEWEHLYPTRCMSHQPPLSNYV